MKLDNFELRFFSSQKHQKWKGFFRTKFWQITQYSRIKKIDINKFWFMSYFFYWILIIKNQVSTAVIFSTLKQKSRPKITIFGAVGSRRLPTLPDGRDGFGGSGRHMMAPGGIWRLLDGSWRLRPLLTALDKFWRFNSKTKYIEVRTVSYQRG